MNEKELFAKIESLKKQGFFLKAVSLIDDNLNNLNDHSKIFWSKEISSLKIRHNEFYNTHIGEALFPVVNEATEENFFIKIKLTDDNNDDIISIKLLDHIKENIISTLNSYLNDHFEGNYLRIFNWNLPNYKILLLKNNNPIDYSEIEGKSFELALFIAYLSKLLTIKVKSNCVFSGIVNNGLIGEVDYVNKKIEITDTAFDGKAIFICNSLEKHARIKILSKKYLKDTIEEIFDGNIINEIKNRKNTIGEYISCEFKTVTKIKKINDTKDKTCNFVLAKFEHNRLNTEKTKEMFEYLNKIRNILLNDINLRTYLIVSGLKPNFLMCYFILPLFNHIKKVLAIENHLLPDNDKTAVILISNNNPDFIEGEII